MRVVALIPDCLEQPAGGLGEQARHLMANMQDCEFEVIGTNAQAASHKGNVEYRPLSMLPLACTQAEALALNLDMQAAYAAELIGAQKPDLIHAFDWTTYTAGIYAARRWRVPLVCTMQLSLRLMIEQRVVVVPDQFASVAELNIAMETRGMANADRMIFVSQDYRRHHPYVEDERARVIYNGIDFSAWSSAEPAPLPGSRPFKLVYIGRFDRMKNVAAIIGAKLPESVDLIFIGSDRGGSTGLYDAVKDRAEADAQVHMVGPKYGPEKLSLLKAADAVVMPSLHEPFGIVALEAMASRSLLLTSFAGGMAEFVPSDIGIPCGVSAESISAAIDGAVRLSPAERARRLDGGEAVARSLDWPVLTEQVRAVYHQVIHN
ncbi:MAG: hypothetical protein COA96_16785 [SAR86 cluster bacterium]|uniref:Glycosyl transferase family 1 n=1 Tax=SAR86 cluster bacterium TaxID=2030880 RepID=A0A2A5AHE4_9GAMM|nr:MAG: hypothetical protein COA96_16785 [SAR86 cluster bacterium]